MAIPASLDETNSQHNIIISLKCKQIINIIG